ncbi:hypothetical protein M2427_007574, partial [Bradyrhizobium sp. BR13661]|nr:hypothetical protein [Bradyrhizobium sp. BR13661]
RSEREIDRQINGKLTLTHPAPKPKQHTLEYIYLQLDQLFSQRLCHCSFTGAAFWTP